MSKILIYIALFFVLASNTNAAPERSGEIILNDFKASGRLVKHADNQIDFELVTGSELLSISNKDQWIPSYSYFKYLLKLTPGQNNILRFIINRQTGDPEFDQWLHCTIRFDEVSASRAKFLVIEGPDICGIEEDGSILLL